MFNKPAVSARELELETADLLPSRETLCALGRHWGGWGGFPGEFGFGGCGGEFGVESFGFPFEGGWGFGGEPFGFGGGWGGEFGFPGEFGFGGGCI